jgi:hypothetical protein
MDLKAREDLQKNNKVQTSKTAFPQKCSCAKLLDERKRGRGEKFMEEWYHVYLLLQKIEREAKGVGSLYMWSVELLISCFAVPLDITD